MLILGSQSKARYQLLRLYNAEIEVITSDIDETFDSKLSYEENVRIVAKKKARDILNKRSLNDDILICADTIVVANNELLLKPIDYNDAFRMIKLFKNNEVKVITGVYLQFKDEVFNFVVTSSIYFGDYSDETITRYLAENPNYLNISGALDIDVIADYLDYEYSGSYTNIIGLPMESISEILYDSSHFNDVILSTSELAPITIYRSSVRGIIFEDDKVVLLNGYTFDKQETFLMSIGGGYHCFEDEKETLKKEAEEEGGLILSNLKHLGNIKEYTRNIRYIDYNKLTMHSYYLATVVGYTDLHYIEYEQELLLGLERYSLDEAIAKLEKQKEYFKDKEYPVYNITITDLEILKEYKKEINKKI